MVAWIEPWMVLNPVLHLDVASVPFYRESTNLSPVVWEAWDLSLSHRRWACFFFNKHRIFLPRSSCSDDRFVLVIQFSERPQCLETSYWRWYLNIAYECLDRRKLFPLSPFRHGLIYGSLLEVKPRQLTGHGSFKEGVLQIEEK